MKKIFILLLSLSFIGAKAQLALSNFNSPGMNGWLMISDANTCGAPWTATYIAKWNSAAFVKIPVATGDSALIAPAVFVPAAAPDRWLISPSFTVNNANQFFLFDHYGSLSGSNKTEEFEILVSTSAGTTKGAFTTLSTLTNSTQSRTLAANLGSFNGQTIRVAIRYKSPNGYLAYLDNFRTKNLSPADAAMVSVTPSLNSVTAYGVVGSTFNISGTVMNLGASSITDYTVYYKEGNNPVQSISSQPFFFGTYDFDQFAFTVPITITSTGQKNIKVWITVAGDTSHANDTLSTKVTGVSYMPKKKICFEEGTGTWCGWCPRGAVFMDSFAEDKTRGTTIAVHNGANDPMLVSNYNAGLTATPGFSGFPGMVVDRRDVIDPSEIFDSYNSDKNMFGFADMKRTTPVISAGNVSTTVTVRPAVNLSGDYRLAFVISEDKLSGVHTPTANWNQVNYYSSTSQNQNLIYKGVNWKDLPNPVPAANMVYNHVARAIYPSYKGDPSMLPANMIAGNDYTATISGSFNSSWNAANIHYSILLIDATTGYVLNSINDSGYLAPNQNFGIYQDTFHHKATSIATSSGAGEVVGRVSLTQGINYTWRINKSEVIIPSGWTMASICDPKNCYIYKDNIRDTFNGRAINEFNVGINHNKVQGYGYAVVTCWKTGEDSSITSKKYKFSQLATNSASVTLVSDVNEKLLYYFDNKIFVDRDFKNAQLQVVDINGRQIMDTKVSSDNIDFVPTTNGIYIATVIKDGQVAKTIKFSTAK